MRCIYGNNNRYADINSSGRSYHRIDDKKKESREVRDLQLRVLQQRGNVSALYERPGSDDRSVVSILYIGYSQCVS